MRIRRNFTPNSGKGILLTIGLIFTGVGLILLTIVAVGTINTKSFIARANQAQGTVVELIRRTSTDSKGKISSYYYPVVKFKAANGETYEFESSNGSNPAAFKVGEAVEILYDPQAVTKAEIRSFWTLWGWVVILAILGGTFTLLGGVFLYFLYSP